MIAFHEAEVDIIDGYHYNNGRNNIIDKVIKNLYDLRLKLKHDNSIAQVVIELLMNSMYGTAIIKPVETDTIIKYSIYDFDKYIALNYNYIDNILEVIGRYCVKQLKTVMSHFKYVHCGVEILSMPKMIMNKDFDVSNDCGVKTYYQDTDSMNLHYDDVDKTVKIYKQTYNHDLVGDGLGNFHVDYSMDGAVAEIYGVERLLLGKTHISIF